MTPSSKTAILLSSESKISHLELPGFTGNYAKLINKLLSHPTKVFISAIFFLIIDQIFSFGLDTLIGIAV